MAKKNQEPDNNQQPTHQGKARSFKPDTTQFYTIKENEQIRGVFLGARMQTITDTRTKQPKDLWVMRLRTEDGEVVKLPCSALLLQAWSDLTDEYGDGDNDATMTYLRSKEMVISRGEDMRTKGGNPMGTYEITVFE